MKQHITTKQWGEITTKEKHTLLAFFREDATDVYKENFTLLGKDVNIGELIEFLGDDWVELMFDEIDGPAGSMVYNDHLCDDLWKAVKYKLKQNDKRS